MCFYMTFYEHVQTCSVYIFISINMYLKLYETLAKHHGKQGQIQTQKPFLIKGLVISK